MWAAGSALPRNIAVGFVCFGWAAERGADLPGGFVPGHTLTNRRVMAELSWVASHLAPAGSPSSRDFLGREGRKEGFSHQRAIWGFIKQVPGPGTAPPARG